VAHSLAAAIVRRTASRLSRSNSSALQPKQSTATYYGNP
jgi:hypothetical protein